MHVRRVRRRWGVRVQCAVCSVQCACVACAACACVQREIKDKNAPSPYKVYRRGACLPLIACCMRCAVCGVRVQCVCAHTVCVCIHRVRVQCASAVCVCRTCVCVCSVHVCSVCACVQCVCVHVCSEQPCTHAAHGRAGVQRPFGHVLSHACATPAAARAYSASALAISSCVGSTPTTALSFSRSRKEPATRRWSWRASGGGGAL